MTSLLVGKTAGLATVQDAGRPGHMHEAVPPGGALVPEWLTRANAAVGNAPGVAAIETFGAITVVARGRVELGTDDGRRVVLAPSEGWTLACASSRVRYLAIRGGIDVPAVLGGRGTLLTAGLGGHEGRALAAGDVLRVGDAPELRPGEPVPPLDLALPIALWPGPDLPRLPPGALETLLSSRPTIDPRSNRVGLRLAGVPPGLAGSPGETDAPSAPMTRGAVQLPPDGTPIVLGPDHPTTGGYPVLAVVASADVGRLFGLPVGATVRFVTASRA